MPRKTHKHYAEEFGVPYNTFQTWLKRGAPYQNEAKMITWLLNLKRLAPGAKKWLESKGINPSVRKSKKKSVPKGLTTAEDFRDYYKAKLAESIEVGDQNQVEFWAKLHLQYDESIRRNEAHAAKLGIDKGTLLSREEVERILGAVMYAGNACIQGVLNSICETLAGKSDPAEIYHFLKPQIVGGRLFSGFDRVKDLPGAPGLPGWVVECVKVEEKEYLNQK